MVSAFVSSGLLDVVGLLNPIVLAIGAIMGWRSDSRAKLFIAAFAAVAVSLLVDALARLAGLSIPTASNAGALAVFPFRFAGGLAAAMIAYEIRRKRP